MPWKPEVEGERPTLGPVVIGWIESMLANPDGANGGVSLTREQVDFVMAFYEIDPTTGQRRRRRGVLSRAKGWGRSPFLGMLAACEAFADVVPAGWDASGRPVGRPWSSVRTPWIQLLAVSESQTRNCWVSLQEMIVDGAAGALPGVDVKETRIDLGRGRIEYTTASAVSREGNRPCFAILDQTESWTISNRGVGLAAAVRRNLAKVGGASVESPNSYRPGTNSVSEQSFAYADAIDQGVTIDDGLYFDHRQAELDLVEGVGDDQIIAALRYAYGDSSDHPDGCVLHTPACPPGWVPLDRIVREIRDENNTVEDLTQYYLNRPTSEAGAFISAEMFDRAIVGPEPA